MTGATSSPAGSHPVDTALARRLDESTQRLTPGESVEWAEGRQRAEQLMQRLRSDEAVSDTALIAQMVYLQGHAAAQGAYLVTIQRELVQLLRAAK